MLVDKSEIRFVSKQMGVNIEGRFRKWKANVDLRPRDPQMSRADLEIDLASIDLASEEAEAEVQRAGWFDTGKFPVARFQSTAMKDLGSDKYEVVGKLTLKGTAKEMTIPVSLPHGPGGQFRRRRPVHREAARIQDRQRAVGRPGSGGRRCDRPARRMVSPRARADCISLPQLLTFPISREASMQQCYRVAAIALGAVLAAAPVVAQEVYVLDARHTTPVFEVTHIGFSQQRGLFGNTTGKVTLDRTAKKGTIDVSIATASLVMAPSLQNIAKGEDFLNVEKFPTMIVQVRRSRIRGGQRGRRQRQIPDVRCHQAGGLQADQLQVRAQCR